MIDKILIFLDGKKTTIGAVLLFIQTFLSQVVVGIWGVEASWIQPTVDTFSWLGLAMAGWGLGHKALKPSNGV